MAKSTQAVAGGQSTPIISNESSVVVGNVSAIASEFFSYYSTRAIEPFVTFQHTSMQAKDRVIVVGVSYEAGGTNRVNSVTYAGLALTKITAASAYYAPTNMTSEIWTLRADDAPASGTVAVAYSDALHVVAGAITLTNVDSSQPIATAFANNPVDGSSTGSITIPRDDAMLVTVSGFSDSNSGMTANAGTLAWRVVGVSTGNNATTGIGYTRPIATASTVTNTYTGGPVQSLVAFGRKVALPNVVTLGNQQLFSLGDDLRLIEGTSHTFTVPTTAFNAGAAYEWKVNGQTVTSATSNSLTVPFTNIGASPTKYSVSVTIIGTPNGSSISATFSDSVDVFVTNSQPTSVVIDASFGNPSPPKEADALTFLSSVIDPGSNDTFNYTWSVTKNGQAYSVTVITRIHLPSRLITMAITR